MMATWPTMTPTGHAGEGSARSTSWRSWPSTTGSLSPVTRGRCCAAKACTPPTSWNGVEPGRPGRWPAWPGRAAPAGAPQSRSSWNASGAATSVWKPSWPAPERRWRSWEKHTRSWNSSPRARTPSRGRAGDRAGLRRAGAAGPHQAGVPAARQATRDPLPATPTPPERTDPAAAAERAQPDRTPTGPGRAARTTVLRPATRAGLGPAAGRRDLPRLDLDHVPAAACPRGEPRPAPAAHPSRPGQAAAGRHPTQRRLELGYHQAPWTRPRQLLRPVRDLGHLQPVRARLAGRPRRVRRARRGVHRRHHRPRRGRPRDRACRPRLLDDLQAGRATAG